MIDKMALLRRAAGDLGLMLNEKQIAQFELYYARLVEWNNRFNLTAITDYEEIQIRHFFDSLSVILACNDLNNKDVIDIGTGAGFPGLPLKIAFPEMRLTLLEATGKKADFLTGLCQELNLNHSSVVNDRAENLARKFGHRENYDVAVSRAVASLDILCELCLPFCRINGMFVALKRHTGAEASSAATALSLLGGRLIQCLDVNSAFLPEGSEIIVIQKTETTPPRFPRRVGMPGKRPLR